MSEHSKTMGMFCISPPPQFKEVGFTASLPLNKDAITLFKDIWVYKVAEIPCEWVFATKFASDCERGGLVHSGAVVT